MPVILPIVYHAHGDLMLTAEDGQTFKLKSSVLSDASSVIKDMLSLPRNTTGPQTLQLPDITGSALKLFLDFIIQSKLPKSDIQLVPSVIDFLLRYDMKTQARRLLDRSVARMSSEHVLPLFIAASKVKDIGCGVRIVAGGWKCEAGLYEYAPTHIGKRARYGTQPTSSSKAGTLHIGEGGIGRKQAAEIRSEWMFALSEADRRCRELLLAKRLPRKEFWAMMAGLFAGGFDN